MGSTPLMFCRSLTLSTSTIPATSASDQVDTLLQSERELPDFADRVFDEPEIAVGPGDDVDQTRAIRR